MSKNIEYAPPKNFSNSLFVPNFHNSSGKPPEAVTSVLDFTPRECYVIFFGFSISAVIGSLLNFSVLLVLLVKMCCDPKNKTASDQLVAFLTAIDFVACSVLFPLECELFSHENCNIEQRNLDKFLTLFLELASTFALLNIAICRYFMVCWATQVKITFSKSVAMSATSGVFSMVSAGAAIYLQARSFTLTVYILGVLSVMVLMALLYYLIFLKLYKRAEVARQRSRSLIQTSVTEKKRQWKRKGRQKSGSEKSNSGNKNKSCVNDTTIIIPNICGNSNIKSNNNNNDKTNENNNKSSSGGNGVNLLTVDFASNWNKTASIKNLEKGKHSPVFATADGTGDEISNIDAAEEDKKSKSSNPLLKKLPTPASQMELMMKRSAKIFLIITAFYILCFMPNAILTLLYLIIGPSFIFSEKPVIIEYIIKYINLFYNLNFILMPTVYAVLNRQFWDDCALLKKKLFKCLGRDPGLNSAAAFRTRAPSFSQSRNPTGVAVSRLQISTIKHPISVTTAIE